MCYMGVQILPMEGTVLGERGAHCKVVCLSAAVRPHYCTDPDVTWGRGRGYPLVVHYWADLQSVHGLRCYGNITRTLVTSLRPSRDMTSDDIVRTLGEVCARCWPVTGG